MCPRRSNIQLDTTGFGNDLVRNRQQDITRSNADPYVRRYVASLNSPKMFIDHFWNTTLWKNQLLQFKISPTVLSNSYPEYALYFCHVSYQNGNDICFIIISVRQNLIHNYSRWILVLTWSCLAADASLIYGSISHRMIFDGDVDR